MIDNEQIDRFIEQEEAAQRVIALDEFFNRESFSCWGLIDLTPAIAGTVTFFCDYDGVPLAHRHDYPDVVMPMMVVTYQGRGVLAIMGDRATGLVRARIWQPVQEGAMPPMDQFSQGARMSTVVGNATRH